MSADHARQIRLEIEEFLATVAPLETPPGAAPTLISFDEIGLEPDFIPTIVGFAAIGLDHFAAHLRRIPALAGRPTIAVALDRIIASNSNLAGAPDLEAAAFSARGVALHELAHAITSNVGASPATPPETFPAWIRTALPTTPETIFDARAHGPAWWHAYATLVARTAVRAPDSLPLRRFLSDAETYGYGAPEDAKAWVLAAISIPDFLECPLAEIPALPRPRFDQLLATRTRQAEPSSTAA